MPKRTLVGPLLIAAGFLVHPAARADIFRCAGAGGTTMFTDLPCPTGMRTMDVITSAKDCGAAGCARVEFDEEAPGRSPQVEQSAIRDDDRRRLEQDLAAREEALRRAEQELAMREQESLKRAEEDTRLRALGSGEDLVPVAPYETSAPYPVVVVPWWPCATVRCYPVPYHPSHRPGNPQHHPHHDDHGGMRGDGGQGNRNPMLPHGDGRSFARQRS